MPAALTHESTERSWKKKVNDYLLYNTSDSLRSRPISEQKNLETPQLVDKNSSSHGCGPQKVAKTIFLLLTP